ncbi:MAG TPA: IS110 family transposase [Paracoccaceae bacterium]|nr:IS110 family transposase [Paracoccaceae bacterium]
MLPDLRTRLSLALLRTWFDPATVLKARRSTLTRFIAQSASGNHPHSGPFVEALVDGLKRAARDALALHGSHLDFAELQTEVVLEVDILLRHLDAIAELERRIGALYAEIHPSDALRTIPGIGPHLAPVLIGVLHTPERFCSEHHIRGSAASFRAAPTPVAPSGRDGRSAIPATTASGARSPLVSNRWQRNGSLLAADTARRIDPELAEVYWRLMTTKGHHHKQALRAVANRLVNRIFRVLRTGKPYGLRDLDGRPVGVAEAKAIVAERYTVPETIRASRRANRLSELHPGAAAGR